MTVALAQGSVFAARYRIVRPIASGGMGAVYEVAHLETQRKLALKVMLPHIVQSADMRDRFRREARVAATVESEHIVDVMDAGIDDATGMPFIVMELLRGEELAKTLQRLGRLGAVETVTLLHQTSLALDKTHRASIVHRDLKPENLFLTEREDGQPRVKVLDFGIAKLLAEGSTQDPGTRSLGTPLYMAPEQFRSGQPISPATDIYALGMIAFTMLVGESYWSQEAQESANVFMFAGAVMQGPKEPATQRAHKRGVAIPAAFDAWFARATALLPRDRWQTASAAVAGLAEALGVPAPGGAALSTSGPLRLSGGYPAAQAPSSPGAAAVSGMQDASTWIYSGSQPRLGTSGAHAVMGSTGSAYGSATGAAPSAPPSGGTGKVVAAIAAGVLIGGIGLGAMFFFRGGQTTTAPGASSVPVTETAAPSASATSAPIVEPSATVTVAASAEPPASAAVPASASPSASPTSRGPAPGHRPKGPSPAPSGKKSIYVRD